LRSNYNSSEDSLAGQLLLACQGVKACDGVFTRPTTTFEAVASDLRSTVGTYMRSHPQPSRPSYTTNSAADDNNSAYYVDRRYGRNDNGYSRGGYNRGGYNRNIRPRGSYRGGNGGRFTTKKCYICGKQGCWSTRHTRDEQRKSRREFRSYVQEKGYGNGDDFAEFLVDFEGLDIISDFEDGNGSTDDTYPSDAWYGSARPFEGNHQFFTTCGPVDGQITIIMLNNAAVMHAIICINLY
jgi:hypothetical protein